jgi:phage shock protein A
LSAEQHSHNKLQQQMAVFAEQLQCARSNLRQAEDKIEALRQEKLFLSQEKAQMGGVLKHLQTTKGVA